MKLINIPWVKWFDEAKVTQPIFYTLSGSHLYGFNSKDSDYDIRGCHIESLPKVIGVSGYHEVREKTIDKDIDFVSFDIAKEIKLILANNSNVLEHWSGKAIYKSEPYKELKPLVEKSISKLVAKPYWGMAQHNLHKYLRTYNESYREAPVKKYLYVLRAYMAGIYVLDTGIIEPNIVKLNKMRKFQIDVVDELVKLKQQGKEKDFINGHPDAEETINKLQKMFKESEEASTLPATPNTYSELNKFLIKWRLK